MKTHKYKNKPLIIIGLKFIFAFFLHCNLAVTKMCWQKCDLADYSVVKVIYRTLG
jgi:hypothetical protein